MHSSGILRSQRSSALVSSRAARLAVLALERMAALVSGCNAKSSLRRLRIRRHKLCEGLKPSADGCEFVTSRGKAWLRGNGRSQRTTSL